MSTFEIRIVCDACNTIIFLDVTDNDAYQVEDWIEAHTKENPQCSP